MLKQDVEINLKQDSPLKQQNDINSNQQHNEQQDQETIIEIQSKQQQQQQQSQQKQQNDNEIILNDHQNNNKDPHDESHYDIEQQKQVRKGATTQDKVDHSMKLNNHNNQFQHDDKLKKQNQTSEGFTEQKFNKGIKLEPLENQNTEKKGEFFNAKKPFFSLKIALTHGRANRVYKEIIKQQAFSISNHANPEDICPCCSQAVQTDDDLIPLLKSSKEDIAHLGPTYPLYFQFMKYSIGLLALILGISGIYNLIENNDGSRCKTLDRLNADTSDSDCTVSFITSLSQSNRQLSDPDEVGSILNLIACIVLIIYSTVFRYRQLKLERDIDRFDVSVSDYTVFINNIPVNKRRKDITEFIQSQVQDVKVMKIVQAFKLQEYNNLNKLLNGGSKKTKREKEEIRKKIEVFEKACFKEENIEQIFSGAVYVSFEQESQALKVVEHFKQSFWQRIKKKNDMSKQFDGQNLYVIPAHEPGDTNWENIEVSTKSKLKRRLFTFIVSLFCIGGSFCAIFFISNKQEDIRKYEQDKTKVQAFTILGSVTTVLINQLLQLIIQMLADFEAHNSKTDTIISVAKKSGIVQFINTTIVQFFVNIIQNGLEIWNNGGLVNDITLLMISNAVVPAFLSILSIENIIKYLQQQYFLMQSEVSKRKYTQMQIHTLFELPQFNPAACFASAANTLLLAAFYAWIIPLGLVFCIISLFLQNIVNKYKLLRRQSMPVPYGAELPSEMIDFYFEIITLFYSLGCLSFELILYKNAHACTIAQVVLAVLFYFLPVNEYMDEKLKFLSNFVETLSYSDAKVLGHFSTDYDRRNPILKSEAVKKYIDFVLDHEKDPIKRSYFQKIFYPDHSKTMTILKLSENQQDLFFKENIARFQQSIKVQPEQDPNNNINENNNNVININQQDTIEEPIQQQQQNQTTLPFKGNQNKVLPI